MPKIIPHDAAMALLGARYHDPEQAETVANWLNSVEDVADGEPGSYNVRPFGDGVYTLARVLSTMTIDEFRKAAS